MIQVALPGEELGVQGCEGCRLLKNVVVDKNAKILGLEGKIELNIDRDKQTARDKSTILAFALIGFILSAAGVISGAAMVACWNGGLVLLSRDADRWLALAALLFCIIGVFLSVGHTWKLYHAIKRRNARPFPENLHQLIYGWSFV